MAFQVQPGALRELSALLDRARDDVESSRSYLTRIKEFQGGEGFLNQVVGGHDAMHGALDQWLSRDDPALSAASRAVADSAAHYEHTDTASAEALDKTYPATDVGQARERFGQHRLDMPSDYAAFGDITEPGSFLTAPKDYADELDGSPGWWETLSPMAHIGNAIETVSHAAVWLGLLTHPYDPQAELVRPFVGDWAGVRAAADVLRNVGTAAHAVANNVKWASQGAECVWRGNAGAAAAAHLVALAEPLDEVSAPLHRLADAYERASAEMVALRDAAVNVLNQVGDAAIQAAASAGFAAGAASTGAGTPLAVVIAVFAGYKVHRVVDGIGALLEIIGKLDAATSVLKAAQTGFGDLQHGIALPAVPDQPLTAPGSHR